MTKVKLTVEKAKEICPDFTLGNGGCRSVVDTEFCALTNHFLCDLVRWKENKLRYAALKGTALSASRLGRLESCARSYAFNYDHHLSVDTDPSWARMGDAFGVARARIDTGMHVDRNGYRKDLLPVELAKVRAAICLYQEAISKRIDVGFPYKAGEVVCELETSFYRMNQPFIGYADAVHRNRSAIFEWKYAAVSYPMLAIARQAAVYFAGVPEATEFTLCVMKKPAHRPGKTEKIEDFESRLTEALMSEPSSYLSFTTIPRNTIDVEGVVREMVESFNRLPFLRELGMPPSYSACSDCSYSSVCEKYIGKTTTQIARAEKEAAK